MPFGTLRIAKPITNSFSPQTPNFTPTKQHLMASDWHKKWNIKFGLAGYA